MEHNTLRDPLHEVKDTYLQPVKVAKLLGLSRATVHVLIDRGELKAHRFSEKAIRVHINDLRDYISGTRVY